MLRLQSYCRGRGWKLGGMVTREIRKSSERVGFRLRDISSGREGWLAKKNEGGGPRIGGYSVVTADLETIGVEALEAAAEDGPDIVLVDEIGPMEMTSQKFRYAISTLLGSGKILVATVRLGTNYKELEAASTRADTMNITLTRENREASLNLIASRIEDWLRRS